MTHRLAFPLAALVAASAVASTAGNAVAAESAPQIQIVNSYSDLADLALSAPIVATVTVKKTVKLDEKNSPGIPPGHVRFLVTATIDRLIVSSRAMPSEIQYLVDVPFNSRGKAPRIKGESALIFLKAGAGNANQFVLSGVHGQIAWTPEADQTIRAVLNEAGTPAGRTRITGIASAFNVPGTVPGESETQIFLSTAEQQPVSLSILRRPGATPQWSVALGEMVDESSTPAGRNTLLWYRLACYLPSAVPQAALSDADPAAQQAIVADYAFVLQQLGSCGRQLQTK